MRPVDLALYADALAGEAVALQARAERARSRIRQAAIERRALSELRPSTCRRLEALGIIGTVDEGAARAELADAAESLTALAELQAWVESKLAAAGDGLPRR